MTAFALNPPILTLYDPGPNLRLWKMQKKSHHYATDYHNNGKLMHVASREALRMRWCFSGFLCLNERDTGSPKQE